MYRDFLPAINIQQKYRSKLPYPLSLETFYSWERLTIQCIFKKKPFSISHRFTLCFACMLVTFLMSHCLSGLRQRIATLFFQYCKTPLFNAEAAKYIKVPQDPAKLKSNTYYCRSCCQYLPSTDFELSTNSR